MKSENDSISSNSDDISFTKIGRANGGRNNFILVSLDGLQTGVPTLTTSTLTPTTLRNIEQTFIELTSEPQSSAPYQAGFVPPPAPFVNFIENSNDQNSMDSTDSGSQSENSWHTPVMHEENSMATDTSSLGNSLNANSNPGITILNGSSTGNDLIINQKEIRGPKKNSGGRRPTKPSNLTPEEEEKRRVRRERNKLAAARCRKRRVDQTNDLLEKVDKLEKDRELLQKQIEEYTALKEDLAYCLETHRNHCRRHHNNNVNSNVIILQNSNNSSNVVGRISPLDMKPIIVQEQFDSKIIKDEPVDSLDSLDDGPPSPKRIMLSQAMQHPLIPPPLPTVSTISTTLAAANTTMLNTPTLMPSSPMKSKTRPNSLNVPLTLKPSQVLLTNKPGMLDCGVSISTPSTGVFNFDSLMDGGTGLTPVASCVPSSCSTLNNKHPLELVTPTSEPSKLVSL